MIIEGAITGKALDVTSRNMARALSIVLSSQAHNAIIDRRTWTASATVTPTGAADEFFYMKNDNTRHDIIISRLQFNAASAETITLARVTGTAAGGTTLTPVNRTLGSGQVPSATIESGVDITGLTPGANLEIWEGTTGDPIDLTNRPIVLGPTEAVALSATTGAIAVIFLVDFYTQLADPVEF
jgi:hypothetical protein